MIDCQPGSRSRSTAGRRDCRKWACGTDGKSSNRDDPDRLHGRVQPDRRRTCRQSEPTRRKYHGRKHLGRGVRAKAVTATPRVTPHRNPHSRRDPIERTAGGGRRAWATTPYFARQFRPRPRCVVTNAPWICSRWAVEFMPLSHWISARRSGLV